MFDITSGVVELLGIPQQFNADAGLAAGSNVSAAGTRVQPAAAAVSGVSAASAAAVLIAVSSAGLSASTLLTADGTVIAAGAAALSVESTLTASGTRIVFGASLSVGPSVLTAAATRVVPVSASIAAVSSVSAGAVMVASAAGVFAADATLTAEGAIAHNLVPDPLTAESDLAPVTALPIYRLVQPTVEVSYSNNVLMSRFPPDSALSVIVRGDVVTVTDYPDTLDLRTADFFYQGGRRYQLSEIEYQRFVAAGRTDLIEVA